MREQRTATWAWAEPEWRVVVRRDGETSPVDGGEVENAEETDADGWVYGDNKWESHSGKGGLGKVRVLPTSGFFLILLRLHWAPDFLLLLLVHALPLLDTHRHLDGDYGTRRTWTYRCLA
jgi:hypothetical protein